MAKLLSNTRAVTVTKFLAGSHSESDLKVPQIRVECGNEGSVEKMSSTPRYNGASTAVRCGSIKRTKSDSRSNRKRIKKTTVEQKQMGNDLTEGHSIKEASKSHSAVSSEQMLSECRREQESLAKAVITDNAMERANSVTYTSDEWEIDSIYSDSEQEHSDSSDDDDPKSQVDKLIELGTLLFMEDESSALSSEGESDDDSSDYDSDITDVSPIISARQSPSGLSPILPRKAIPTSPLAIHDNRQPPQLDYYHIPKNTNSFSDINKINSKNEKDSTNMELLMQAVIELEHSNKYRRSSGTRSLPRPHSKSDSRSSPVFIHPIRDNPHHRHLRKLTRKNMSFSNEEVRKIDRDNNILLKKIITVHNRAKSPLHTSMHQKPTRTSSSSSSINRRKEEERIRRDNMVILKKIQEAKPTKAINRSRISSSSLS